MSFPPIHRVVTGHDGNGDAVVSENGPLPTVRELAAAPGVVFHEVWNTSGAPTLVGNGPDPTTGDLILPPPAHGTPAKTDRTRPTTSAVSSSNPRDTPSPCAAATARSRPA